MTPTTEELRELLAAFDTAYSECEQHNATVPFETASFSVPLTREVIRLRDELSVAIGYMMQANIDLSAGDTSRTALALKGGITRARAALSQEGEGDG